MALRRGTLSCLFCFFNHVCVCWDSSLHIKHLVVDLIAMAVFLKRQVNSTETLLRRRLAARSARSKNHVRCEEAADRPLKLQTSEFPCIKEMNFFFI